MGLSKDQLRRRARTLRANARRGRACGGCIVLVTIIATALGLTQVALNPMYDPALDARCVKTLKQTQREWFETRACHYDAREGHADFVAAELALRVRAKHAPGPCVVMTVGLPTAGRDYVYSEKVLRREGAVEPGLAVNMGFWLESMLEAGAFECETRTYVDERAVATLRKTLLSRGHENAIVDKLWNDRRASRQLDEEFDNAVQSSPHAKLTVLINDAKRSRSQFARFAKGLASGKVATLIWRREISNKAQKKALLKEVKLVTRYGYSIYLAGASVDHTGRVSPTAYLRIDHGAWDDIYSMPNTGIELTLVAVARDNKFKSLLDQTFGLCPVKATVLNFNEPKGHNCHCDVDKFSDEIADPKCSLNARLGSSTYNWFWSFLTGRTKTAGVELEELEQALESFKDGDDRKM